MHEIIKCTAYFINLISVYSYLFIIFIFISFSCMSCKLEAGRKVYRQLYYQKKTCNVMTNSWPKKEKYEWPALLFIFLWFVLQNDVEWICKGIHFCFTVLLTLEKKKKSSSKIFDTFISFTLRSLCNECFDRCECLLSHFMHVFEVCMKYIGETWYTSQSMMLTTSQVST